MKKLHLSLYCFILAVGNCFVPIMLLSVANLMRISYHHILGDAPLGRETEIALGWPVWFFVFTGLFWAAFALIWIPKFPISRLTHSLLALCIIECIALLYFVWYVFLSIQW